MARPTRLVVHRDAPIRSGPPGPEPGTGPIDHRPTSDGGPAAGITRPECDPHGARTKHVNAITISSTARHPAAIESFSDSLPTERSGASDSAEQFAPVREPERAPFTSDRNAERGPEPSIQPSESAPPSISDHYSLSPANELCQHLVKKCFGGPGSPGFHTGIAGHSLRTRRTGADRLSLTGRQATPGGGTGRRFLRSVRGSPHPTRYRAGSNPAPGRSGPLGRRTGRARRRGRRRRDLRPWGRRRLPR